MAKRKKPQRYPAVEWISAAIGLVLIAWMLGFLALEAAHPGNGTPPLLDTKPVGFVAAGSQYVVEVEVTNAGLRTAGGVQVEGTLKDGDSEVETSSASISYVPGGSRRRAGLIFTHDPRDYRLQLRATGYERP